MTGARSKIQQNATSDYTFIGTLYYQGQFSERFRLYSDFSYNYYYNDIKNQYDQNDASNYIIQDTYNEYKTIRYLMSKENIRYRPRYR